MEHHPEPAAPARALRIAIFGLGYVGTTTAACLLKDGHALLGIDISRDKVDAVGSGRSPVVEPEVQGLLESGHRSGRLQAALRLNGWVDRLDLAIVCVGTPSRADGKLDMAHLLEVTRQIGHDLAARDRAL